MKYLLFLFCLLVVEVIPYDNKDNTNDNLSLQFCESYVECAAVALLEERLCLGNSRKRPYWLPNRHDVKECHEKLKNDYRMIELLEVDMDNQYMACLSEHIEPLSEEQESKCTADSLQSVSKFSFGRTITYIPTNCFTGLERRTERECGIAKKCCTSLDKCDGVLNNSSISRTIDSLRTNLLKRAKDCEKGVAIAELASPDGFLLSNDVDASWAPTGNVNVRINDVESLARQQHRQQNEENRKDGFVNVRFSTADKTSNGETFEEKARRLLHRKGDRFNSHGNGPLGEVSNPTGGSELNKAVFPKLSEKTGNNGNANRLENDGGVLTIGIKEPELSFPDQSNKDALISEEQREDERKRGNLPKNIEAHDKKFEEALRNTNQYKHQIESFEPTSELVNKGINSLLDAVKASSGHMGVATGTVHPIVNDEEDSEFISSDNFVTSSPLILVKTQKTRYELHGCGSRAYSAKTRLFEKILNALGEKVDSKDMKEMRDLIDAWHNNFRKKVVTAKDKAINKEIEKSLEELIKHFDDVNLSLIKAEANATFPSDDYPEKDSELTGCGLQEDGSSEKERKEDETIIAELIDDDGNTVMVDQDGIEKIVLSGEAVNISSSIDDIESSTPWNNEEYKKEVEKYRKEHHREINTTAVRNETSCDLYMRCRNQMHIAVDGCAWRFAAGNVLSSLAESAESLLYKGEAPCNPSHQPLYEELYEMLIQRNNKLRNCLDKRNEKFFADSVCLPYDKAEHQKYQKAMTRILSADYSDAISCYMDANRIQEKCSKLRDCCPNFDECRESELDINLEQAVISMTARINEGKQECIKEKARTAFKKTLRGLLGKGGEESVKMLKDGSLGLDIRKGAQLLRRIR